MALAAYEVGAGQPNGVVTWLAGAREWGFLKPAGTINAREHGAGLAAMARRAGNAQVRERGSLSDGLSAGPSLVAVLRPVLDIDFPGGMRPSAT